MKDAIVEILKSGTGSGVDLFATLFVYPLEDGRFAVTYDMHKNSEEQIFTTAEEAADYFLEQRQEKRLGFEFEYNGN